MRALRYDRVLAGTALALILAAAPAGTLGAAPDTPAAFEAAVPMPDLPPLPPPTLSDVDAARATIPGTVTAAPAAAPVPDTAPQTANIAPAETVAPDPLATLDPADRAIAEKMRDLLVAKVDKIFGPGNAWVTAAKQLVANDAEGAACDLPAGPSEVMVVADDSARAEFVAAAI